MGGIFGALGNVGAAYQQAKALRRKEQIEQSYADIQRQYAQTNAARTQLEYQKLKLEMDPKAQAERDRSYLTNLFGRAPSDEELQRFAKVAPPLRVGSLKQVKDDSSPTGWSWEGGDLSTGGTAVRIPGAPAPAGGRLTKGPIVPDPSSITGYAQVMLDAQGNAVKHVQNVVVPGMQPRITEGWTKTTDADGNEILVPTETVSRRESPPIPGLTPPAGTPAAPTTDTRTPKIIGHRPTKPAALKPEVQAGVAALRAALWGTPDVPGLSSTVGVLDSGTSRDKLIVAGVGKPPDPNESAISRLYRRRVFDTLTNQEQDFANQLARAIGAINALRPLLGNPRSATQLTSQYASELPSPDRTTSSARANYQLRLVERELTAALNAVAAGGTPAGVPAIPQPITSGATDQPTAAPVDTDTLIRQLFGPPPAKPSAGAPR